MTKYSTEFKEAAVRKMMPPNAMPVRDVRQETGVTNVTLYKWRNEYRRKGIAVPGDDIKPDNWKGQDKLAVVIGSFLTHGFLHRHLYCCPDYQRFLYPCIKTLQNQCYFNFICCRGK
ncbi:MAG: transposase [Gammaproteobacteria bacterium]|nr:transposase [Gammaproteobacteria bacterium]